MLKLARILLPVDFSAHGAGAARSAGALARHFGAELTLLYINPVTAPALQVPSEFGGSIDSGWITALETQRGRELGTYQEAEFHGVNLKTVATSGDPARRIVAYAHQEQTDLIVIPTRGYGPFRRFLLGSVTAKVLHDADCPVWTGAHLGEESKRTSETMKHVLCAVDNSAPGERVLDWAWRFSGEFGSQLTVIHAIPVVDAAEEFLDPAGFGKRRSTAEAQIQCLQTKTGARGDILVKTGDPAKVVAEAATLMNADVVVIGRSPEKGVLGRLRTNAYSIIRDSPCPVVSV